jgi:hypothetical protein
MARALALDCVHVTGQVGDHKAKFHMWHFAYIQARCTSWAALLAFWPDDGGRARIRFCSPFWPKGLDRGGETNTTPNHNPMQKVTPDQMLAAGGIFVVACATLAIFIKVLLCRRRNQAERQPVMAAANWSGNPHRLVIGIPATPHSQRVAMAYQFVED